MRFVRFLLAGAMLCLSACSPVGSAGHFDRKQMESLVSQVRLRPFGGDQEFWWDVVSGSATLVSGPGRPAKRLFARRNPEAKLTVVIMTEWGSHGTNQAGFAYYDEPPTEGPDGYGENALDVPGDLQIPTYKQAVDAHWREVYNPYAD